MRFASDLYEHPQLTDSEVWDKDAHNQSGASRFFAALGVLLIITITSIAAIQYAGYASLLKTVGLNDNAFISALRL